MKTVNEQFLALKVTSKQFWTQYFEDRVSTPSCLPCPTGFGGAVVCVDTVRVVVTVWVVFAVVTVVIGVVVGTVGVVFVVVVESQSAGANILWLRDRKLYSSEHQTHRHRKYR